MKISKITSLILAGSAFMLIGCGGGSSSSSSISTLKTITVKASDAYVVALPDPATITLINGNSYSTTKVDSNGTIVFDNLPQNIDLTNAKVYIPDSAIVDTDGNGQLSEGDQTIRMHLRVKLTNQNQEVANPLTTIAVEQNNDEVLDQVDSFDPVKAKLELTQKYDEKLAKLVALNDGIANAIKDAKENNENPEDVIKNIDIDKLQEIIDNPTIDVETALKTTIKDADEEAIQKAVEVVQLAQEANQLVKEGKITPHEGLVALVAVSDADVDPNIVKEALEEGNVEAIIQSLPKDERVQIHLQEHQEYQNEMTLENQEHQEYQNEITLENQEHLTPPQIPQSEAE